MDKVNRAIQIPTTLRLGEGMGQRTRSFCPGCDSLQVNWRPFLGNYNCSRCGDEFDAPIKKTLRRQEQ